MTMTTVKIDSKTAYTSARKSIEMLETTGGFCYRDMDAPFEGSIKQLTYLSTHLHKLVLAPHRTILPPPNVIRKGRRATPSDAYRARPRSI